MLLKKKFVKNKSSQRKLKALWDRAESNCRHKDFQSFALPTELQSRCFVRANIGTFFKFKAISEYFF